MNPDPIEEIRVLSLGVRAVAMALTLVIACLNTQLTFSLELVRKLLQDAMPGAPVPGFALFIMQARTIWLIISFAPPIMAVLTAFFARDDRRALTTLSVLIVLIFIQGSLTSLALYYFIFQWPFEGMVNTHQTSAVYDTLAGDGLNTWVGYLRLVLVIIALAISMFFFWRFIRLRRHIISN
jgi:hypothetical protein